MQREYISDELLAIGDTLVRFCSKTGGRVFVKAQENGISLSQMGAGSVIADSAAELEIGEGYMHLNSRSIHALRITRLVLPSSLRSVDMPIIHSMRKLDEVELHRALSGEETKRFLHGSIPVAKDKRLITCRDTGLGDAELIADLSKAVSESSMGYPDAKFRYIFLEAAKGKPDLFAKRRCFDLTGRVGETEEYSAVMDMLREGVTGYREAESERRSDLLVRTGGNPDLARKQLSYIWFAHPSVLHIEKAFLFAPALYPVRYEGKEWYLYSRLHLTGDAMQTYLREDMCIFGRDELLTDRQKAEKIYAKARLMMCL